MTPAVLALLLQVAEPVLTEPVLTEEDAYVVERFLTPEGERLEVGGLAFLPDGRLALSTRRGQVWLVENALAADPQEARFQLFADGLQEGLGLAVVGGELLVLQRMELTRLSDTDGDGRADRFETVCDDWGVSGNYHEFAFGLPRDGRGNLYMTLNVGFGDPLWFHGQSTVPWRGWVSRIGPDGSFTPLASGVRSPAGLGLDLQDRLFVTDNQGDWVASSPIYHVREGRFYGHPASLAWHEEYLRHGAQPSHTEPPTLERTPPAVWIPYKWSRSTANLVPDSTGGAFGPFAGQLLVGELTNGMVLRCQLEEVQGELQGVVWPLRQRVGSVYRLLFAPDDTLFVGLTHRGWGGVPPGDGLARIRWTGRLPMEMHEVHLAQDGFRITFTKPVAADVALSPADVSLTQYDYNYWWEYGSPEQHTTKREVAAVELSPDRQTLTVRATGLAAAMCARLKLTGVRAEDGSPLLHDEFAYTINQLPQGPRTKELVAKVVPPPPPRAQGDEGWLHLSWIDATDQFRFTGWSHCDAELDPVDATRFVLGPGDGALVNLPYTPPPEPAAPGAPEAPLNMNSGSSGPPSDFVSKPVFGDAKYSFEFMLPEGGRSAVALLGRYALLLEPDEACGALVLPDGTEVPPELPAFRSAGQWHNLDLTFEAPRFDAEGKKVKNARLVRALMDDVMLHENVELAGPSQGYEGDESPTGPLLIAGTLGTVAVRDIWAKRVDLDVDDEAVAAGWVKVWNGQDLEGWTRSGGASWVVEDGVLTGSGATGHLFSPRADYRDVEVRASLRINEGGNSGLYVRATPPPTGETWPAGYEAQVNSDFDDPQRTGSLYGLAPVKAQLVSPGTWFDYQVACREEDAGTHITLWVNGVMITDYVDPERLHAAGHVALQQHHDGSEIECRKLEVREIAGR